MSRYRTIVADPPWEIGDFPKWGKQLGTTPCPYPTMTLREIEALPVGDLAALEAHLYLWTIPSLLRESFSVAEAWGFEPQYPLVWCKPHIEGLGGKFKSNVEFILFCRERHGAARITAFVADAATAAGLSVRDVNKAMGTSDMAGWWLSRISHRARVPTWEQWKDLQRLIGFDERFDDEVRDVNNRRVDPITCPTRWFDWRRGKHSEKPEAFLDLVEQQSSGPYLEMFARRARFGWDYWGDESLGTVELAS